MKYLFLAEYQDGHRIAQTSEDHRPSAVDGPSRFTEVLNYGQPLQSFTLVGEGSVWSLDFRTLTFTVDERSFQLHNTSIYPLSDVRVEYARVMEQDIEVTVATGKGRSVGGRYISTYFGWSGKDRFGNPVKHLIYI